ncbi:protein FAN-like [Diadema setosum]|uniref:protein FAN-like n=1 Tax=Diadema setosum TaxID=31175 RepID=UPI003B3A5EC0
MAFVDEDFSIKERFSLLLLDPGEIYFEDFSVYYYLTGLKDVSEEEAMQRRCRGRLKICSKSIVFDPQDVSYPIIKFPLRSCVKVEEWTPPLIFKIGSKRDTLVIHTKQTIEMKAGNEIGPYHFKKGETWHYFTLNFGTAEDVVHPTNQLARAATLPMADQDAMIATIVFSRQKRVSFDTSRLDSLYETIAMEMVGERITPLVVNPGRIMVTSDRLYFQPFNNVEPVPVMKIKLSDIKRLVKRRFLLKHVGLEIFCSDTSIQSDMFLVLSKPEERDALYSKIMGQNGVRLQESGRENIMLLWQNGVISNFDYLMYLNSQADRSVNDITQYPVFPWVLADYTSLELDLSDPATFRDLSKPIGALNPERLQRFKERRKDMPEPKFLYGSHYSTPGYVLYYLVRVAPEHALCLQNGRFDQPDRLFKSVAETWSNVQLLPSDVKEVIPEFYQPEMADFLINRKGLKLGTCQDGSTVTNVALPPWADDEVDFCRKCRQALESEHVSHRLHQWIDLIFGYKQKGSEAEKADNVFYYLTYEGAIDLDSISDPNEKASLQAQIMEFGQTPKQLFTKPHPARFSTPASSTGTAATAATGVPQEEPQTASGHPSAGPPPSSLDACTGPSRSPSEGLSESRTNDSQGMSFESPPADDQLQDPESSSNQIGKKSPRSPWERITHLQPSFHYKLHKDSVCDLKLSSDNKTVFSVSKDTQLKMYSLEDQRQLRSVSLSNMSLSAVLVTPDDKNAVIASWDNSIYVYSVDYGRVLEVIPAHDDAVSALCWQHNTPIIASASWDSTVKMWSCQGLANGGQRIEAELLAELDHDTGVTCAVLSQDGTLLLSGTKEGDVNLWSVEHQMVMRHIQSHSGAVNAVTFSPDGQQMASAGQDCYIRVVDVNTGTEVFAKDGEHGVRCLCWHDNILLAGDSSGHLLVWDMAKAQLVASFNHHSGAVNCIQASPDGSLVITAGEDAKIIVWKSS